MRLRLDRMHEVRELHRVLDEEDRDVVTDEVPVAFIGVELDGKAAHIARGVSRAALAGDGRKAHEHGCSLAGFREDRCARELSERLVALEEAVSRRASRM